MRSHLEPFMDSTRVPTPPRPVDRPGLLRPIALAGVLWLLLAGLLGLGFLYWLAAAPLASLLYLVPAVLFAIFGLRLITRRGVGLPLLSLVLGTLLAGLGILEATRQDPSASTDTLTWSAYGLVIVAASALGVWSARTEFPALRHGLGRRVLLALAVVAVFAGAGVVAVNVGPLRGCVPIAPRELPSGAAPGAGVEDVAGGAKQVVWGSGSDRVEQIVGLTYWETFGLEDSPTLVAHGTVRGQAATIYRMSPESGMGPRLQLGRGGLRPDGVPGPGHDPGAGRGLRRSLLSVMATPGKRQ
jgi:hypothetical protein